MSRGGLYQRLALVHHFVPGLEVQARQKILHFHREAHARDLAPTHTNGSALAADLQPASLGASYAPDADAKPVCVPAADAVLAGAHRTASCRRQAAKSKLKPKQSLQVHSQKSGPQD